MKFSYYQAHALISELEEIDQIKDPVHQAKAWFEWRTGALKFLRLSQSAKTQGNHLLLPDHPPLQNLTKIHLITSRN